MKLLLDTHAFIWWDSEPSKLSPQAFTLCQDQANTIFISVVSVWKMQIKFQLGKLKLKLPLATLIESQQQTNGIEVLPITLMHVLELDNLPMYHKDPFDRLLIAQSRRSYTMKEWYEQDEFWQAFSEMMFPEKVWENAVNEVDGIIALTNLPQNSSVLDLACGPGRHCISFARRGFSVTGVDRTAFYLDQAKKRAEDENLNVEWIHEDMRRFCRPDAFDLAINMLTAFGYFQDPSDDVVVAKNLYRSLKHGGKLVMDIMGKEVLARIFRANDWQEYPDGTIMLQERKINPGWDWIENRWIVIKGSERKDFSLSHRIYSAVELSQLLLIAGFSSVQTYGDAAGSPYDNNAKRLVMVAQKDSS